MDQYCKHILTEYSRGGSILEVCTQLGMPSIAVVKKWLFNKEYKYENAGFRESFLQVQKNMLFCYHEELRDKLENLKDITGNDDKERNANYRKAAKEQRDFTRAVQWFKCHLELLAKLYDHHNRGLDFPIEGIHFDAILSSPRTGALHSPSSKVSIWDKLSNLDFDSINLNFSFKIYSSITRAEAEKILGTPLLYGRIHKRTRQKDKPETTQPNETNPETETPKITEPNTSSDVLHTLSSHLPGISNPQSKSQNPEFTHRKSKTFISLPSGVIVNPQFPNRKLKSFFNSS